MSRVFVHHYSPLEQAVSDLRRVLSQTAQSRHSGAAKGSPHKGYYWQRCPSLVCQEVLKVWESTGELIPELSNPHALKNARIHRGKYLAG